MEESRVCLIGIVVEDISATERLNEILHDYREHIIGRMGVPYRARDISVISIVLDAPGEVISALSGKLGRLKGVSAKALYSKL